MENNTREFEKNMSLEKNEAMGNFVTWLYGVIKPHLGSTVAEAGAGIGTYSNQCALDGKQVYAYEFSDEYMALLKQKYSDTPNIHLMQGDITTQAFVDALKSKNLDSIYSLNVLEHIDNDQQALHNFYEVLKPGGTAVVLVPAHKWLFNSLDKNVGHVRRYSKKEFKQKIGATKFELTKLFYFNSPAILGWYVNGNVMKKEKIDSSATDAFNSIVPLVKFVERYILRGTVGISLIAVLKKPLGAAAA